MQRPGNYVQEIQRFTTSQYWNSGIRITSGVMVPLLIMVYQGWLSLGIPFLFGALFVSLTDSPGPIHHRRNGMLVATCLNTMTVFITGVMYHQPVLLLSQVVIFSFFFSLLGIYGARAGAVGTLALVIMLIHMSPLRQEQPLGVNAVLTAGGGLWYAAFSLLLNRLKPYRVVEQALGENLLLIATYVRARSAFYSAGENLNDTYNHVMQQQVVVFKSQDQLRELLFKTRQFVSDASPRSRSAMMIFLESLDLFEEAMYSYQDYGTMKVNAPKEIIQLTYRLILHLVSELERIGLLIQAGIPVKNIPSLDGLLDMQQASIKDYQRATLTPAESQSLLALGQTGENIRGLISRLRKIAHYSRLEAYDPERFPDQELEMPGPADPLTFALLKENLTFRSNNFRYALRMTAAMIVALGVSAMFALSHAYWVMLTVLTILKPVYNITRKRNIQRVLGTLGGVVLGSLLLFLVSNTTILIVVMITCMIVAYSFLRVNYLGFVIFLTTYILVTFHFLNPLQFKSLIGERLIDTLVGSVIAALASRYLFPVWQQYNIRPAMRKMMVANTAYFLSAWNVLQHPVSHRKQYNAARNEAIVALTNLSDNFQQMLTEPGQVKQAPLVHQFVIANLTLTSRISALSEKDVEVSTEAQRWVEKISDRLQSGYAFLVQDHDAATKLMQPLPLLSQTQHAFSIIYSLANDIRGISKKLTQGD